MFEFSDIGSVLEGLKNGEMVVVVDDPSRENEGDLVMVAEKVTDQAINFMAKYGRGLICMPLELKLIEQLELPQMVGANTDGYGTAFTVSIDVDNKSTGISAHDRAQTILKAVEPSATAYDFVRPGHVFPLAAKQGGVLERKGHTEASVDLAKLSGHKGAAVICEILNEDGTMARLPELIEFAQKHQLKLMTIEDLVAYREQLSTDVEKVVAEENLFSDNSLKQTVDNDMPVWLEKAAITQMPTAYGDFEAVGFVDHRTGAHHMALVMGADALTAENNVPTLVRMHSECLTGDVFGSKRCDCGQQLDAALKSIFEAKAGVLIYLRQEGRGIGLINKLKCYELQERGYDTVTANLELGFEADLRDYVIGAEMLKALKVNRISLMTNNPEKIDCLERNGIVVENRLVNKVEVYPENKSYLQTKIEKMNHMIAL